MRNIFSILLILAFACQNNPEKESPHFTEVSPATVGFSTDRLERIDTLIKEYIDSGYFNNAVALIARDGKLVYHKAFGTEDIGSTDPLPKDAIFRIASQTKAITSVAVMMLYEEGKFLLDDPISKYIPEFSNPQVLEKLNYSDTSFTVVPANKEITIRHLLTHTSGIDYSFIGNEDMKAIYTKHNVPVGFVSEKMELDDAIKRLAKLPLIHHPGEKFTYGLNTDVLGYLVEKTSGMNLSDFFYSRIFKPLGMVDTYFYLPEDKHERLISVNTESKNKKSIKMENPPPMVTYPLVEGTYYSGGAGLSSTIKDYAIFLQMLLNGGEYNGQRLLSRRSIELMTTNQIGDIKLDGNHMGLGFFVVSEEGQAKTSMSEGSYGWGGFFGTSYWIDPKEKLVGLLFLQQWPLSKNDIHEKYKTLVYQAMVD